MTTAGLAIVFMVFAYVSDSLPSSLISNLDNSLVLNDKKTPKLMPWIARIDREKRVAAFERFMLALSDQQLVTGLAILTTSFALRCTISGLNFQIATSLAWFSSTVHLVTLYMLEDYLRKHKKSFYCRIVLIVVIFAMLAISTITQSRLGGYQVVQPYPGLPLQCLLETNESEPGALVPSVYACITLGLLLASAILKIAAGLTFSNFVTYSCVYLSSGFQRSSITVYNEAFRLASSELRSGSFAHGFWNPYDVYSEAFLSVFAGIGFAISYGLTSCILSIWPSGSVRIAKDTGALPFGQLLPLVLLGLPCLAAIETFNELEVDAAARDAQLSSSNVSESEELNELFHEKFNSIMRYCCTEVFNLPRNAFDDARRSERTLLPRAKRTLLDLLASREQAENTSLQADRSYYLFSCSISISSGIAAGTIIAFFNHASLGNWGPFLIFLYIGIVSILAFWSITIIRYVLAIKRLRPLVEAQRLDNIVSARTGQPETHEPEQPLSNAGTSTVGSQITSQSNDDDRPSGVVSVDIDAPGPGDLARASSVNTDDIELVTRRGTASRIV